jgi:hypothetical protein
MLRCLLLTALNVCLYIHPHLVASEIPYPSLLSQSSHGRLPWLDCLHRGGSLPSVELQVCRSHSLVELCHSGHNIANINVNVTLHPRTQRRKHDTVAIKVGRHGCIFLHVIQQSHGRLGVSPAETQNLMALT